jgi:arylsulfatase A-like enzyme
MGRCRLQTFAYICTGLFFLDSDSRAADRPNVLFIALDDLNDWVGFLDGYEGVRTPNMDRFAARGLVFTRAYCAAPACNPSRTALLTGLRPSTTGVYHNNQPWRRALPDAVTLPKRFMDAGYHVIGGGKIFHGAMNDRAAWHDYVARGGDPRPPNRPVNGIARAAHFDWGPVDVGDEQMHDAQTVEWAAGELAKKHDKPLFLAVGLTRPHLPWYAPRKYFDMYPLESIKLPATKADDLDDVPKIGRQMANPEGDHRRVIEANQWKHAVRGYLASITFADAQIGRLIDALDKGPLAKGTIVVLWGDHGWHLGEKQHWRKFALWEEATRVPLIVLAPGMTKPGVRCERTVSLLDLQPTLLELCGVPAVKSDGQSLAPLLADPTRPWEHAALTTHGRGNHAVRTEHFRFIRYSDGGEELYDHRVDPLEHTNLAADPKHAATKRELARFLPATDAVDAGGRRRAAEAPRGRGD